jgi:hypothetical protein
MSISILCADEEQWAVWIAGLLVGAVVVVFNAIGLARVSVHARRMSRRASVEAGALASTYRLPWFRGWKEEGVARRRFVFMTIFGILVGIGIIVESLTYRP